jgi:hypothetical protein
MSRAVTIALIVYGVSLARSDHDYQNTILWFGGGTGLAGLTAACVAATSRRRYEWVLAAGAVLIALGIAVLLWKASADGSLSWNSCTHDCAEGETNPYLGLAFIYVVNLIGWAVGATLGRGVR